MRIPFFALFGNILKANKNPYCELSDVQLDAFCTRIGNLFLLWNGDVSYASKVDPSPADIWMYNRLVSAAVYCHIAEGCNITPKVHLMWRHVAVQMNLPGGLEQKRID